MSKEFQVRFADRMNQLPPYLFGMINKMKMEKRWQGDDVIDLGMGNPIDPAPGSVTEKLCEVAADPKIHRYPAIAGGMKNLNLPPGETAQFDVHFIVGSSITVLFETEVIAHGPTWKTSLISTPIDTHEKNTT